MATNKGFIKDWWGNYVLPITRGELVLDSDGKIALNSEKFLANADGNGLPGLVTAAERKLLLGGVDGSGGIADLYNKLDFINKGFKVNGTTLNFYDSKGNSTPINLVSNPATGITINHSNNVVNLSLTELFSNSTELSTIIRNINVDKYGRVTSVSGSNLSNSDLPEIIESKKLSGCTTLAKEIGDNELAVVNKAYVDAKWAQLTGEALGALKFGASVSDRETALSYLINTSYWNKYFKVTGNFDLPREKFYDTAGITSDNVSLKIGDTFIVYPVSDSVLEASFIYIPSGDDKMVLEIKQMENGDSVNIAASTEHISLTFSDVFSLLENPTGSGNVSISLPRANKSTNGYLSAEDYNKFSSYQTSLGASYTGEITESTPGSYKIGTLQVGEATYAIIGKYGSTTVSLENGNGTLAEYNPILKFVTVGSDDVNITFKNVGGIGIRKNGNDIEFKGMNEVVTQAVPQLASRDVQYLTIVDGYKFGVKLGSIDASGNIVDGLTDFSQFNALASLVRNTFETFDYSLSGAESAVEYRYGNEKLKTAITLTTI